MGILSRVLGKDDDPGDDEPNDGSDAEGVSLVDQLRASLADDPGAWSVRRRLAESLLAVGNAAAAAKTLSEAPEFPGDVSEQIFCAKTYAETNPKGAADILRHVLAEDGGNLAAHLLFARVMEGRGYAEEARIHYSYVVEKSPDLADAELAAKLGLG